MKLFLIQHQYLYQQIIFKIEKYELLIIKNKKKVFCLDQLKVLIIHT